MFDCLRVKVPGWLRRLVGGSKKVEGVREDSADAVALERRRWVEFRNFVAVSLPDSAMWALCASPLIDEVTTYRDLSPRRSSSAPPSSPPTSSLTTPVPQIGNF